MKQIVIEKAIEEKTEEYTVWKYIAEMDGCEWEGYSQEEAIGGLIYFCFRDEFEILEISEKEGHDKRKTECEMARIFWRNTKLSNYTPPAEFFLENQKGERNGTEGIEKTPQNA